MDQTTNLSLPYIMAAQAQKHVTHNEALRAQDAIVHLSVTARTVSAPPASPVEGERYIVATGPSGDWLNKADQIAAYQDGALMYYAPQEGWICWVEAEDALYAFDGSAWGSVGGGSGSVNPANMVGVNTVADATNRLSVKSDAVLVSHDDVTPGSGDIRAKLNKAGVNKTASLLFQANWAGRAEIGLTGNDEFRLKVSSDGTNYTDALIADHTNGIVRAPEAPAFEARGVATNNVGIVDSDSVTLNNGGHFASNKFTAPVSGVYSFQWELLHFSAIVSAAHHKLYMNGSELGARSAYTAMPANTFVSAGSSRTLALSAGDTVEIYSAAANLWVGTDICVFNGFFLG